MEKIIHKISKKLVSSRKSIKTVEPLMLEVRDKITIRDNTFYNMLITITEAVNNAIVHGNKCDPGKNIHLEIIVTAGSVKVIVADEGNGFNPDDVEDPREPENLMKEHGRGVFLMKELADKAVFTTNKKGTKVELEFEVKK